MPTKQCSTIDSTTTDNTKQRPRIDNKDITQTSNKQLKVLQGKPEKGEKLSNQTNNYSSQ